MQLTVDVTRLDIENGVRKNTRACPIACAMLRALHSLEPHRYEVAIGEDSFGIFDTRESRVYEYKTPPIASNFIQEYDKGLHPLPIRFEFDMRSGKPSQRGMHHFGGHHNYIVYNLYAGDWDIKPPKMKSVEIISNKGFTVPLHYKLPSLSKKQVEYFTGEWKSIPVVSLDMETPKVQITDKEINDFLSTVNVEEPELVKV